MLPTNSIFTKSASSIFVLTTQNILITRSVFVSAQGVKTFNRIKNVTFTMLCSRVVSYMCANNLAVLLERVRTILSNCNEGYVTGYQLRD